MRAARDRFLSENGFDLASYTSPHLPLHLGPWTVRVANPGLLPWHDMHHIATGYATSVIGEAEISVFELRGGVASPLVRALCVSAVFCGLWRAPRRMWQAWRRAAKVRTLYDKSISYETLLDMTVLDLRRYLGLA